MNLTGKRILVTGGAGFVGSHLVDRLIEEEPAAICVVDDFSLGKAENLWDAMQLFTNLDVYNVNMASYTQVRHLFKEVFPTDIVFDLAANPLVQSIQSPMPVIMDAVAMICCLCECAREGLFRTLVHFSSSEAYGTFRDGEAMTESHPQMPETPYAAGKVAADHVLFSYKRTFGIDAIAVRPFNQYGPRQNAGKYAAIIPLMIGRLLRGEPLEIYGDGEQTRDFLYVTDTVEAVLALCKSKQIRQLHFPVNVASGQETSMNQVVQILQKVSGRNGAVVHREPRPADVRRHLGGTALFRHLTGYLPKVGLEEGLRRTFEWYSSRVQ